jgi:predicted nucleic acid-binding protein
MHRLRGADAVYAAIARRYATTLVTRDEQQRQRASDVVPCLTPQEALDRRA